MEISKASKQLLLKVVEATLNGGDAPFLMYNPKNVKQLFELGLVEQTADISEGDELATRATEAGIEFLKELEKSNESSFEIEDSVPLAPRKRAGKGAKKYPFEKMEVGNSFHVPATEKKPDPAKSLASTCSSAANRFKDENGNKTREFTVRRVGDEDPKGPGARIWRTF